VMNTMTLRNCLSLHHRALSAMLQWALSHIYLKTGARSFSNQSFAIKAGNRGS
jgi:hypothetical protein